MNNSKKYGRYFGICPSYHHAKACKCVVCPSYPGTDEMMYCARGTDRPAGKKMGCLCTECGGYKKFGLEGDYFCQNL
ncbi:MAG: DUF2769 domain-containing protein [Methanohalobium sp.]|uniref:DUF2769 domain-containing protein n=1 Tax=Methanohalobium sp. TaxID=2837493 RepID=UPI00397AC7AB